MTAFRHMSSWRRRLSSRTGTGRERLPAVAPIDGTQLRDLVRARDDALDRVGNERLTPGAFGEGAEQQERHVPQVLLVHRLDGERRDLDRIYPPGGLGDALRDRLAVLVELVLPQEA